MTHVLDIHVGDGPELIVVSSQTAYMSVLGPELILVSSQPAYS